MTISYVIKLWIVLALGLMVSTIWPIYESEGEGQPQEASPEKSQAVDSQIPDLQTSGGPKEETTSDENKSEETTLVERLRARSMELEKRAPRVQEEEQRIDALRRDLEALAKQQAKVAEEAAAALEAEKSKGKEDPAQKSLAHLLKVYEAMDPDEAALRIGKMKESLALEILAGIKAKKAAGMLAGVEPAKAARLSKGLRFYVKGKRKK